MLFIGDVHGKYKQYAAIMDEHRNTIQVGDMGVGFRRLGGARDGEFSSNPPYDKMVAGGHMFIRGNHDNPAACRRHTQCIQDGTVHNNMMFIGGAVSIDKNYRTEGYSWWPDEELSDPELDVLVQKYIDAKPDIMVTHECPEEIANNCMVPLAGGIKLDFPSRTRMAFQRMWSAHSPRIWVFGHWHNSLDKIVNGTRFVCLAELECKDIS